MSNVNIWTNEYNPFNKWKTLAWYERMLAIKKGKFKAPVNIALDIIQGTQDHKMCGGFNCNFCMSNYEEKGRIAKIPKDILLQIPKFYHNWGVKSICIAGHNSDPCLYNHKVLIKFLRLCKKWNIEVGFVSNGSLYTDELMKIVAKTCVWSGWSINAGTEKTHSKITNTRGSFSTIINNIKKMSLYKKQNNLNHTIGYKYLITDDNYSEIIDAVKIAKDIGVNHFQIRPCNLPKDRIEKIDVQEVESQIKESLKYEKPGEFEIFGIREKFTLNFSKKAPKRCIASPLGSTWKADGEIVICPDRRWSSHLPNMTLGNFITEGLDVIKNKWGGEQHKIMIIEANKNIKNCIRCTAYTWMEIYENCVEKDLMNITLI